jgi:hypothetical protein
MRQLKTKTFSRVINQMDLLRHHLRVDSPVRSSGLGAHLWMMIRMRFPHKDVHDQVGSYEFKTIHQSQKASQQN